MKNSPQFLEYIRDKLVTNIIFIPMCNERSRAVLGIILILAINLLIK